MASAALSERDLACFARLWNSDAFREASHIATRRATVGTAPIPAALMRGPDPWMVKDPKIPGWALPIIRHRHLLQGTALAIRRAAGETEYWKLVYMVKSPPFLAMSRLHPADEHLPSSALHEPRDSLYHFRCNFADFTNAAEVVAPAPADSLSILFRLFHNGGTYMSSDMYPMGLSQLLAGQ